MTPSELAVGAGNVEIIANLEPPRKFYTNSRLDQDTFAYACPEGTKYQASMKASGSF